MLCMILKTRGFQRWAKKVGLLDEALSVAVSEMAEGLFDADLGGGVVKKRVALPGQGKRGSTRTLLATNRNDRWIFIFGFEKNKRANISSQELASLRMLAEDLLALDSVQIVKAIDSGALLEVTDEKSKKTQ